MTVELSNTWCPWMPLHAPIAGFLTYVYSMDWVVRHDGGQPIVLLEDGVAIMEKLEAAQVPLFGLTNWSAETFPYAWENYPVLRRFRDIVVSGRVGLVKPDPAIFAAMRERIDANLPGTQPSELVFIDDNPKNAAAATALGWHGVHHTSAAQTEAQLRALGLPV